MLCWKRKGIKICNRDHLNSGSVRVDKTKERWSQISSGEKKGGELDNTAPNEVPKQVLG